jgi:hypothetical protein
MQEETNPDVNIENIVIQENKTENEENPVL